jgi:hypothetical protein
MVWNPGIVSTRALSILEEYLGTPATRYSILLQEPAPAPSSLRDWRARLTALELTDLYLNLGEKFSQNPGGQHCFPSAGTVTMRKH